MGEMRENCPNWCATNGVVKRVLIREMAMMVMSHMKRMDLLELVHKTTIFLLKRLMPPTARKESWKPMSCR